MKRAIEWFARNPVAANLLLILVLLGGLSTIPVVGLQTFPDIEVEALTVAVEYRGASPEEVEEGICIRVEEAIAGLADLEELRSTAVEGSCLVVAELVSGADVAEALDEVKNRVDGIDTFPEEAEEPVIAQVTMRRSVIDVAISGDTDERSLKQIAERVRDEIAALPGVTQVELSNARPYEVSIEVPEEMLRRHGLSFDEVAAAVRHSSLDLPGGTLKTDAGEVLLRTKGQAYWGREFEDIVVLTRADGTRVTLADVGRVVDGFEDTDQNARFDGRPAVMVRVFRVGEQDELHISRAVKEYVATAAERLPQGIELTVWQDSSKPLRDRLGVLVSDGLSGFALVVLTLALYLRPRLAFWVALGVPVSFLGGLWMLPVLDITINVISLFGFILVLGVVVDDAIVVGENVHTREGRGEPKLEAAIRGTQEVAVPVIFGVLTTVAAFLPMLLVPGPMGQIMSTMGLVVMACLLFSLAESQLVLPAHLGHERERAGPENRVLRAVTGFQERVSESLERFIRGPYRRLLERALDARYLTLAIGVAVLLCAGAVVASGWLRFSFFPPLEADYVSAQLSMPQGTPARVTAEAVEQIQATALRLRAELGAEHPDAGGIVRHWLTSVGEQPYRNAQTQGSMQAGAGADHGGHLGEVVLELLPSESRPVAAREVARRWRELTPAIPDAVELVFSSSLFSVGNAIDIQLQGRDVDELRGAAERVKEQLAEYPGVIDIADSFRAGKQEIRLRILPSAEALGLTLDDLARQVRQAFYGEEVQRIQRGRDDVRVMVRYPPDQRSSMGDLENLRIRASDGAQVPFETVARAELGHGYAAIRRTDRQRVVNVTADVDLTRTSENEVLADLANMDGGGLGEVLRDYPGVTVSLEGAQREQQQSMLALLRWYPVALFVIYTLLAVPLRSYFQPLLIMSVIPFGLAGAIAGHLIMGQNLSFMSVMGFIALSGMVVNASLVLVHYINSRREAGAGLVEAVREAGVARFRAIMLTEVTTFVGLAPLILERSVQAQFLVPMAISLGFGVLFAAFITLLMVPCGYLVLEDLAALAARRPRPHALEVAAD